jgi:hypothetical protein
MQFDQMMPAFAALARCFKANSSSVRLVIYPIYWHAIYLEPTRHFAYHSSPKYMDMRCCQRAHPHRCPQATAESYRRMEYDRAHCTRRCAATGRELRPGETFYSVLLAEGTNLVRHDYSAEAWQGAPEKAVGWWKSQLPAREGVRLHWAPNDVMLDLLEQLADDSVRADMRYVLALLLVRRRVCRLEETQHDQQGRETLVLFCPRREQEYRVSVATPDDKRTKEIQDELAQLLFAA